MQTCPNCGQENPEDARFCNACAAPLATEAPERRKERKTVTVVFVDLVGFGHTAAAAYARVRAAEALGAAGREADAAVQRAQAEAFYRNVGARRFVRDVEALGGASAESRRASAHS